MVLLTLLDLARLGGDEFYSVFCSMRLREKRFSSPQLPLLLYFCRGMNRSVSVKPADNHDKLEDHPFPSFFATFFLPSATGPEHPFFTLNRFRKSPPRRKNSRRNDGTACFKASPAQSKKRNPSASLCISACGRVNIFE